MADVASTATNAAGGILKTGLKLLPVFTAVTMGLGFVGAGPAFLDPAFDAAADLAADFI